MPLWMDVTASTNGRATMKCQHCEKPATFHITELTGDEPSELHFCEEHARVYLTQSDEPQEPTSSLAGVLAQHLESGADGRGFGAVGPAGLPGLRGDVL